MDARMTYKQFREAVKTTQSFFVSLRIKYSHQNKIKGLSHFIFDSFYHV